MSLTAEKCLQAWTNSLRQMNAKADIVFFGDSLTYYGDFSSAFPDKVVCNLGLRGDTIQGMIDRVEQVALLEPNVVYIMAGVNDVANNTEDQFGLVFCALIQQIQLRLPSSRIITFSLTPVNDLCFTVSCSNSQICKFNSTINRIARKRGITYIDLFSVYEENGILPKALTIDGIHLTNEGYGKWYNALIDINV